MPTPGKNEKESDFVGRCIPIVLKEGTAKDQDQAAAICFSMWRESKKKKHSADDYKESSMYVRTEEIERRCLPSSEIRLDIQAENAPKITGYAAVFDTWADIGGLFRESVRSGAFAKTIKENDVRALMNHDPNYVLARNKAGTLKLREDKKGLAVEIDPPLTTWANDLTTSMKRGDITQMSFGFKVNKDEVDFDNDERVLTDVTLFDVSIVTFPAYPTTTAQVRSAFQGHQEEKNKWKRFDELVEKIKSGGTLTPEENREMLSFLPSLSVPAASHTETIPEPPAKHSDLDTSKGKDEISRPWIEHIRELENYWAKKVT